MKNYYAAFLEEKNKYSPETKVSKVSKGQSEGEKGAFDTFDTECCGVNAKNLTTKTENPPSDNIVELSGQYCPQPFEPCNNLLLQPTLENSNAVTTTQLQRELSWFDKCANCQSEIYESAGQWFCPTNCR